MTKKRRKKIKQQKLIVGHKAKLKGTRVIVGQTHRIPHSRGGHRIPFGKVLEKAVSLAKK